MISFFKGVVYVLYWYCFGDYNPYYEEAERCKEALQYVHTFNQQLIDDYAFILKHYSPELWYRMEGRSGKPPHPLSGSWTIDEMQRWKWMEQYNKEHDFTK